MAKTFGILLNLLANCVEDPENQADIYSRLERNERIFDAQCSFGQIPAGWFVWYRYLHVNLDSSFSTR
eukprot:Awhi_evm2s734